MKYLLIFTLFLQLSVSFNSQAQNESKRPSWSQGLPERPSANQPGKPDFKSEPNQSGLSTTPEVQTERLATPVLEIELSTQPDMTFNVNSNPSEKDMDIEATRRGFAHFQNWDILDKEINPLHAKYHWNLVKTKPIDIPAHYATKDLLKVRIYINPDGEVIKVTAGAPDVPALMFKKAQQSIQDWEFDPPKKLGITENLAKTFEIEIKTS